MSGAKRIEQVRQRLRQEDLHALVVTSPVNRRYLTGFLGSAGTAVIGLDDADLLTDFRYTQQANEQAKHFRVIETQAAADELKRSLERMGARRVAFEEAFVTVREHRELTEAVPVEWVGLVGVVEALRAIKDEDELKAITDAVALADRAFDYVLDRVKGRTEKEVALDLELFMRTEGAERLAFPPIVASGPNGALPHAAPSDRVISEGDLVTLDFGAVVRGYCSDMTRTIAVGKADERQRELYRLVLRAQETGVAAVRPGRLGKEVDAEARQVIVDAGLGERFGHGLGHGVGLDIHEDWPRLSPRGNVRLAPGMVTSVEPGVYIPGWGGIRIEDLVVVEGDGCRVLTRSPKELIVA